MNITIHVPSRVPVSAYGGTERVMWGLARTLADDGHAVTLLAPEGSGPCKFAKVSIIDPTRPLEQQIADSCDIVHFNNYSPADPSLPHLTTMHGNRNPEPITRNAVFVSRNHAERHGAEAFVHNGLDWSAYPAPDLRRERSGATFLGKAAWRVKNVRGAIAATRSAGWRLDVMGGSRLNLKMGFRFTPWPSVRFHGMVDDNRKAELLSRSRALLFPVIWDEPFGLAVIEAMYYGAPVIASPYGSLPELVTTDTGRVCSSLKEVTAVLRDFPRFDPEACHARAAEHFSARAMTDAYLRLYSRVIAGEPLNPSAPHSAPLRRYPDFNKG